MLALLALAGASAADGQAAGDCGCVYFDPNRQILASPGRGEGRVLDIDPLGDGVRRPIQVLRSRSGKPAVLRFPGPSKVPVYASPDRLLVTFDSPEAAGEVLRGCPGEDAEAVACLESGDGRVIRLETRYLGGDSYLLVAEVESARTERHRERGEAPALLAFRQLAEVRAPPEDRTSGDPVRSLSLDTIQFLPGFTGRGGALGGAGGGGAGGRGGGGWGAARSGGSGAVPPPCPLGRPRWPTLRTGAEEVWNGCGGQQPALEGSGVRIAVVDSGVDPVPHLDDRLVAEFDARFPAPTQPGVPDGPACDLPLDADDEWGHGTAIAVLAAANRSALYPGTAPDAEVLALRAFDRTGCGCSASLVAAIGCAAEQEADVITAAWVLEGGPLPLLDAIEAADEALVVAAAGNANRDLVAQPLYPANWRGQLDNLLVVSGSDRCDRWHYAGGEGIVDLIGPAIRVKVWSLAGGGSWMLGDGTSWAVGITSGVAAVHLQQSGAAAPTDTRTDLADSARLRGAYDDCCTDCGFLDVQAAVCAQPTPVTDSDPRGCPLPGSP